MTNRCRGDLGQAGGFEAVAFGLLIFMIGSLVVTSAWAAIDVKLAVNAASRDAARAYVEAPDAESAWVRADAAARAAIAGQGRDPARLHDVTIEPLGAPYGRCVRMVAVVAYPMPVLSLPWVGTLGDGIVIRASHSELVDPYRSGGAGPSSCA